MPGRSDRPVGGRRIANRRGPVLCGLQVRVNAAGRPAPKSISAGVLAPVTQDINYRADHTTKMPGRSARRIGSRRIGNRTSNSSSSNGNSTGRAARDARTY
ncbi:hypothetical protein GE09DRAFT_1223419 [Coniochaeta sp. 2T2.1]|nr:hypothetical protein GE09DRAFT_1223419 [Coniochaeta sp. 2T2.1]